MTLAPLRFVEGAHVGYYVLSASNTSGPGDSTRGGCGCARASPRTYSAPTCTGIMCTDMWTHHVYYDHARADTHTHTCTPGTPLRKGHVSGPVRALPVAWPWSTAANEQCVCGHSPGGTSCGLSGVRGWFLRSPGGPSCLPADACEPALPLPFLCLSAVFIIYASLAFSTRL